MERPTGERLLALPLRSCRAWRGCCRAWRGGRVPPNVRRTESPEAPYTQAPVAVLAGGSQAYSQAGGVEHVKAVASVLRIKGLSAQGSDKREKQGGGEAHSGVFSVINTRVLL